MTLPLFEPTYSVSQLCGEVKAFLGEAFAALWVVGEAQRVRASQRGHLYFELVEKGATVSVGEIVGVVEGPGTREPVRSAFTGVVMGVLAHSGERLREGQPVAWMRVA